MSTIFRKGDKAPYVRSIQRALNEIMQLDLKADRVFGNITEANLKAFQKLHEVPVTGVYDEPTQAILDVYIARRFLKEQDFVDAAQFMKVSVAKVKAVQEVESKGDGFLNDGRPTILYERHVFRRELKKFLTENPAEMEAMGSKLGVRGQYSAIDSHLVAKYGSIYGASGGYMGGPAEYVRLERARTIHAASASRSASWGLFQIMGYHHGVMGFGTINDMIKSYTESESQQLKSFCDFVLADNNLITALRKGDWTRFAKGYNGSGYANAGNGVGYDKLMADAHDKFAIQ